MHVDRLKLEKEDEMKGALTTLACTSVTGHMAVIRGLLYGILVEVKYATKYMKVLGGVVGEKWLEVVEEVKKLTKDRFQRLLEPVRVQLVWMVGWMVQLGVEESESLLLELMRQVMSGNVSSKRNAVSISEILSILQANRTWLYNHPSIIPIIAYSIASIIPDHHRPEFEALREREIQILVQLFRERFDSVKTAGRDLIRVLYNISLIPEIKSIWDQVILAPSTSSSDQTNLKQILASPSPRHILISRLTPEMESWLSFVFTHVKTGSQSYYQKWFAAKFLSSPENESLVPDLVRWIVAVHHPTNAILQSNILPRYKFVGWLIGACLRNPHFQQNARQALFYDWYFYNPSKDNIMNIEPGALLLMNTLQKDPNFVNALSEHLMISTDNYLVSHVPQLREEMRKSVHQATRLMIEKKVVLSFEPLYSCSHMSQPLRDALKKVFENLSSKNHTPTQAIQGQASIVAMRNSQETGQETTKQETKESRQETPPHSHTPPPTNSSTSPSPSSSLEIPLPSTSHQNEGMTRKKSFSQKESPFFPSESSAATNFSSLSSSLSTLSSQTISSSSSSSSTQSQSSPLDQFSYDSTSSTISTDNDKKEDSFGSMFDGWKAALSSSGAVGGVGVGVGVGTGAVGGVGALGGLGGTFGGFGIVNKDSSSPTFHSSSNLMDVDFSDSDVRHSQEIIINTSPSSRYVEQLLTLTKRVEAGNVRLSKTALESLLSSSSSDWIQSTFSSSDMNDFASKILEILAIELIEYWHGETSRTISIPSPSNFVHSQLFQSLIPSDSNDKHIDQSFMLALLTAMRGKEKSFGSRFVCFLLASNQPSSTVDINSINSDVNQDDLFQALIQCEEEKSRLEEREEDSLSTPNWIHPYVEFITHISKSIGKNVNEVFLDDMMQLALANVACFNSVVPLVCRYLPNYCTGSSPFVHLALRTCLPPNTNTLHGALSSQTFRLIGTHLKSILKDSLKWESYTQQLLWSVVASEFLTQSEPVIEALVELLPSLQDSYGGVEVGAVSGSTTSISTSIPSSSNSYHEALHGSLTLISLIGPSPKLIHAILSMNIKSYDFSTSVFVRWMVEDEFQSELSKKLPSVLTSIAKQASGSNLKRAVMHLALVYAAIPSDMDVLLEYAPLRRNLLGHFKSTCTDNAFSALQQACAEKEDKEKAIETKRGSRKRIHEEDQNEEGEEASTTTTPPLPPTTATASTTTSSSKSAPPKAKRKKVEEDQTEEGEETSPTTTASSSKSAPSKAKRKKAD
jgi:integrator complex subunit 3